jgi:hypothetical protein
MADIVSTPSVSTGAPVFVVGEAGAGLGRNRILGDQDASEAGRQS